MEFSAIKELDARNYMTVFNRQNLCFTRGEGCKLYDTTGKEYTDFVAGIAVNVLGHRHPALTAAIKAQADTFLHVSNLYYIKEQAEMWRKAARRHHFRPRIFVQQRRRSQRGRAEISAQILL